MSWDKVLLIAAALALGALSNVSQLSASQQVSKSTMRGAPVLSSGAAQDGSSSSVDGLDWAYATQWSNGIPDLMSLLVPRFVGGSSAEEVPPTTELARRMQMNGVQPGKDGNYKVGLYWGPMPFNGGPYYAGTVLVLLYILSWFCIPRHISTGFGIGILLCMLLSMGSHASFFNRPLFDFLPLFNKFRAPNSAVAVMPFFLILPAIWGLHNLLKYQSWNEQKKLILKSAGICVTGYALIYLIAPSLLSFIGPKEVTFAEDIQKLFVQDRTDLLRSDTLRCLLFLVLSAGTLLLLGLGKSKSYVPILLCVIGLIDIWGVNRRYFDDSGFSPNREASDRFDPRPVDEQIFQLERRGRGYYRVFDLSIDVFNSASTSYHHNTIGGYSPKKPQRYQDLIERYISKGNTGILNMLNTKYVIQKDGRLQTNPGAYGNCWFVSQITDVKTPDEEIAVLGSTDLNTTAVILKSEFVKELDGFSVGDGTGSIELTSYTPNRLVYSTDVTSEQLAVFSEIWMEDGWYATIDGVEAPIIRVNYDFRGLKIPAGSKEVVFSYEPRMSLAYINLICSLLIFGGLFFGGYRLWKEQSILAETSPKVAPQSLSKTKKKITKATQSKKASIKSKRGKKK